MKHTTFILSFGYWFSAYTLGLLLHPYKTVREFIRVPTFQPMVLSPVVIWAVFWVVGMVGLRFGGVLLGLLGLVATDRFKNILAFLFWWGTSFLGLWQVLLFYLFGRFWSAFR